MGDANGAVGGGSPVSVSLDLTRHGPKDTPVYHCFISITLSPPRECLQESVSYDQCGWLYGPSASATCLPGPLAPAVGGMASISILHQLGSRTQNIFVPALDGSSVPTGFIDALVGRRVEELTSQQTT